MKNFVIWLIALIIETIIVLIVVLPLYFTMEHFNAPEYYKGVMVGVFVVLIRVKGLKKELRKYFKWEPKN